MPKVFNENLRRKHHRTSLFSRTVDGLHLFFVVCFFSNGVHQCLLWKMVAYSKSYPDTKKIWTHLGSEELHFILIAKFDEADGNGGSSLYQSVTSNACICSVCVVYVCVCVHAQVRACMRACVCVCMHA